MSVKELLFSFQGRINRRTFWIWNACYYVVIMVVATVLKEFYPAGLGTILPVCLVVLVVPDLAVTAKRWHDRNKSNKFLLLNIPVIMGRFTVPVGGLAAQSQPTTMETALSMAALICGLWILIECGFLKGNAAENQYGQPQA
ncbi:DUF805 domain-containing protein [Vibrio albus]|uniref:DUF805 domain-containing protein n=1 Tax=Vibrio albus TaxID=2200953 RepID=A0A2U3BAB9_9VIBR|nr:DUF805 domain-containing protein [Vibrio albus]PWI33728.1 DUF805 domain-containing protein [Vibrio albus]